MNEDRKGGGVEQSAGGIGVVGLLGVLFVGLKLTGYIAWSWWWVLAPFWVPVALVFAGLAVVATVLTLRQARRRNGWRA